MRPESSYGSSLQHRPGPRAVTSRRNSKFKGTEVGVCPAFVKKQQGGRCGWDGMRGKERARKGGRWVRRERSPGAVEAIVRAVASRLGQAGVESGRAAGSMLQGSQVVVNILVKTVGYI